MQFFDRQEEIEYLRQERELAKKSARMTVVTGRRRVGKTQLLQKAFGDVPYIYLLVTRRAETDQCADFVERVKSVLPISLYGKGVRFGALFKALMEESCRRSFTLVIDELQEFWKIDEGIFGEIQEHWDRYHAESKINFVTCGSVNTLMNKIFFNEGQPLYGRSTSRMQIEPFRLPVLKEILSTYNPAWNSDDLLALWTFTGGVARYVEELMDRGYVTREAMMNGILDEHSFFLDEGKSVLVQEFGKEYGIYFSILSAIARGVTTRNEIEQLVGTSIGGYLTRLEADYGLISRRQPLYEKGANKSSRYRITDNFFAFWFRFIFRNADLIELRRFDVLKEVLHRDYETFSGFSLEGYFKEKFIEERQYTRIGSWWDRRGENEIDLVCEDEPSGRLDFYEVKREKSRINLNVLKTKAEAFLAKNPQLKGHRTTFNGLTMQDM
ncbi:MAG: ATP-binding protein [Victivallales bacterium]|nr:ATP-binding protein [Victivallales bacterium]